MGRRNKAGRRAQSRSTSTNGSPAISTSITNDGSSSGEILEQTLTGKDEELRRLLAELLPYRETVGEAERKAEAIIVDARREAEETKAAIRADEASLRQDYLRQRETEIEMLRKAAEVEADNIRLQAHQEAEEELARSREEIAQEKRVVEEILSNALAEKEELIARATEDLERTRKEQETELEERKKLFQMRVTNRERELNEKAKELRRHEENVKIREEDLLFDIETTKLRREELQKRWNECSPDRVWGLERELESANGKASQMAQIVYQLQQEVSGLRNEQVVSAGMPVSVLISDLEENRNIVKQLRDRLAAYPNETALAELKLDAVEARTLRDQVFSLQHQLSSLEDRAVRIDLGQRELQQVKVQAEGLRILNEELRNELQQNSEALAQKSGQCFPGLLELDKLSAAIPIRPQQSQAKGQHLLRHLVAQVRDFAASRPIPLYYSETDIRAFIAGLATSPFLILQGLSGTGKTSLPKVFSEAIKGAEKRITVQSNWRDRHELLGYYNDFTKRFTESEFTQAVYEAGLPSQQDVPWFIVLDEMNLARCEYFFADFLSVLEERDRQKWMVELMSFDPSKGGISGPKYLENGRSLRIPSNLWFIGTVNQDESTVEITDKVYDRAQVMEFKDRQIRFEGVKSAKAYETTLQTLTRAFEYSIENTAYQLEAAHWDYIYGLDAFLRKRFDITFGNRVEEQFKKFVPVFVSCGGSKEEALDFQLARKVLRKLDRCHSPRMKQSLPDLANMLNECPPSLQPLKLSLDIVKRKSESAI